MTKYSYADTVVLDVQFLLGRNKENIIKELAILPVTHPTPKYFLFKPPFPFFKLSKRNQYQNLYNCRYINALDWYCGNVDHSALSDILTTYQSSTIIVKGLEKKAAIIKYLPGANIIDIQEEIEVIRFEDAHDFVHNCPYHSVGFQRCAINNVYKLRRLMEQKNLFSRN